MRKEVYSLLLRLLRLPKKHSFVEEIHGYSLVNLSKAEGAEESLKHNSLEKSGSF